MVLNPLNSSNLEQEGINQTLASHNKKKANINGYKICNAITTVISLLCNWFHIKLYGVDLQLSHT